MHADRKGSLGELFVCDECGDGVLWKDARAHRLVEVDGRQYAGLDEASMRGWVRLQIYGRAHDRRPGEDGFVRAVVGLKEDPVLCPRCAFAILGGLSRLTVKKPEGGGD